MEDENGQVREDQDQHQYLIQSLVRGVELLRCFNRHQPALSIPEVAEQMGLNRTTAYRFLYTLRHLGLLEYDAETRRYSLSTGVLQLGFDYLNSLTLVESAIPLLRALRDDLGESTHLGVLEGSAVVYLARVPVDRIISATVSVGARLPAASTSMGRVLLAHLSEEVLKSALRGVDLRPRTTQSPSSVAQLRAVLENVRRDGYAITDQEFEPGVFSIAAPVRDRTNQVVAAINVTGPTDRFGQKVIHERHIPAVLRVAGELSAALGYRVPAA